MKKPRVKVNGRGIKGLLIKHVEKLALGVLALVALVIVYSGAKVEGVDASLQPDRIESAARSAEQHLRADTWQDESAQRDEQLNFPQRADLSLVPTSLEGYATTLPLDPPTTPAVTRRHDPQLFTVEYLETTVVSGPIAILPRRLLGQAYGGGYGGEGGRAAPGPRTSAPYGGRGGRGPAMSRDPYSPPGADRRRRGNRDRRGREYDSFGSSENADGFAYEDVRTLSPNQMARIGDLFAPPADPEVTVRPALFVVVTGLVPFKEQIEEYDRTFKDAAGYDPQRDYPEYLDYLVQRADVTGGGPPQWEDVKLSTERDERVRSWPEIQEIADPAYLDPYLALVYPLPPLLMRDPATYALHSRVSAMSAQSDYGSSYGLEEDSLQNAPTMDEGPSAPGALRGRSGGLGLGGGEAAYGGRRGGMNMMLRGGRTGMPIGRDPYGGEGGRGGYSPYGMGMTGEQADHKMFRFFDFDVQPGRKYAYRVKVQYVDPNDYNPMAGSAGVAGSGGVPLPLLAPDVMTRVQDAARQRLERARQWLAVGKQKIEQAKQDARSRESLLIDATRYYMYVAMMGIEFAQPPFTYSRDEPLTPDKLLRELEKAQGFKPEWLDLVTGEPPLPHIDSDWSEPSPTVTVTSGHRVLVSTVKPASGLREPTAEVIVHAFNDKDNVDVTMKLRSVTRGDWINPSTGSQLEAVDPLTLEFKKVSGQAFRTNTLVVDIMGGETLPTKDKEKVGEELTSPGDLLVVDASGTIRVRNELDDYNYHRSVYFEYEDPMDQMNGFGEDPYYQAPRRGRGGSNRNRMPAPYR